MTSLAQTKRPRFFFGWWIVISCAVSFAYGGGVWFYGFTAFFDPIINEFGWSRAVTSLAYSLQRLESGLEAPIVGWLTDKLGPRKLMLFGRTVIGAGLIFLSRVDSLWAFYAGFVIVAAGTGFGFAVPVSTAIANWFFERRSRAFGITWVGYGLSGTLVPLLVWFIAEYGWRHTLFLAGLGMWAISIPLALVVRHKPEQYGYLPDGATQRPATEVTVSAAEAHGFLEVKETGFAEVNFTALEALRTRGFWLLALGLSLSNLAVSGMMIHMIPYLSSIDIPRETGALTITGITLCSLVGRLGFGWLGDIYEKRKLITTAFLFQFTGLLILANISDPWHIIPFLLFFGPGYGGPIPLRLALMGDYFGRQAFGTLQGLYFFSAMWPGIAAPVFAGWMFDTTGSYKWAIYIFAAIILVAVPIIWSLRPPQKAAVTVSI